MHGFDAHGTQGELQTEVAHHGYHEGVVVEFARVFLGTCKNAHDLIAVDHIAFAVYGKATVGVTVECHAQVGSGCLDHGLQLFGVCGSGVLVDVVAVWRSVDHAHVGSCAAQRFRRDHGGGAVGAVSHDFQAFQRCRLGLVRPDGGDCGYQMVDVQVGCGCRVVADTSHACTGRAFPILTEHVFDFVFFGVRQFESAACEEFDAVVGHGIVGCGDHGTHFHVQHGGQVCDARGWNNARVDHIETACGHACRQCCGEKIAGNAGITADQCATTTVEFAFVSIIAKHAHRSIAQIQCKLCGQSPIRQSSNTVCSEHTWHESQVLAISSYIAVHHRTQRVHHSTK